MRRRRRRRRAALPEASGNVPPGGALQPDDFDRLFAAAGLADDDAPPLLAVSGGSDSTAMMHALAAWSRRHVRPTPLVATVDHGLRPEARREAEQVARAASALDLPHTILTWRPGLEQRSQAEAREARYTLLVRHAKERGATRLLTAHTLDDQAETVLIRLSKGSGPTGLAGMRMHSVQDGIGHTRPFLEIAKDQLISTCRANGWSFIEDPSNADARYDRPRWRRLAPMLEAEGLTAARLALFAKRLGRAEDALDAVVDRAETLCVYRMPLGSGMNSPQQRHAEERPAGASRSMHDRGASFETAAEPVLGPAGGRTRGRLPQDDEVGSFGPDFQDDEGEGVRPRSTASILDWPRLSAEPREIALRVLGRVLARTCGTTRPRLERVETAFAEFSAAAAKGSALRRTLNGCLLDLDRDGRLTVSPEPDRRRGR